MLPLPSIATGPLQSSAVLVLFVTCTQFVGPAGEAPPPPEFTCVHVPFWQPHSLLLVQLYSFGWPFKHAPAGSDDT